MCIFILQTEKVKRRSPLLLDEIWVSSLEQGRRGDYFGKGRHGEPVVARIFDASNGSNEKIPPSPTLPFTASLSQTGPKANIDASATL